MIPLLSAQIRALHVGEVQTLGGDAYSAKPWATGFFKTPVEGALWLGVPSSDGTRAGLEGDAQADLVFHGGPEKAVCVYPAEHYLFWREELGLDLCDGAFGENFTLQGLLETDVCIGDVFRVGEQKLAPLVQVSQPRQPCWKLARRWNVKNLALQVQQQGKTGWYLRVLRPGWVEKNMILRRESRPHPEWPVALANQIMHHRRTDLEAAAQLGNCPLLSTSWKQTLAKRVEQGFPDDPSNRLKI